MSIKNLMADADWRPGQTRAMLKSVIFRKRQRLRARANCRESGNGDSTRTNA